LWDVRLEAGSPSASLRQTSGWRDPCPGNEVATSSIKRSMKSLRRAWRLVLLTVAAAIVVLPCLSLRTAEATIAEQRARLPPPAHCEDPVEGVWKSHMYRPRWGEWECFYLEIHRVPGSETQLTGTIKNHSWQGGHDDQEPGPCRGRDQWVVSMDGRGTITGDQIVFGGIGGWRLDRVFCGRGPWGYNLDNFSGTIDPELLEFQSLNNDGGRAVNEPTLFRRIRCFPPGAQPHIQVDPPPFYPDRRTGGCGGL